MPTITSEATLIIEEGAPIEVAETVTFLGIGSAGDPSAARVVTPPNSLLAPITYWGNPTRTLNLDNNVLYKPISSAVLTLGSRRVVRFETNVEDVIVTEIGTGDDSRASMPTFFLRQLYEYLINPPVFDSEDQEYIMWEPRDRNARVFNVEFVDLIVGGGEDFDVMDLRDLGGKFKGGSMSNALDGLNVLETGLVDREVRLVMRIVSEV